MCPMLIKFFRLNSVTLRGWRLFSLTLSIAIWTYMMFFLSLLGKLCSGGHVLALYRHDYLGSTDSSCLLQVSPCVLCWFTLHVYICWIVLIRFLTLLLLNGVAYSWESPFSRPPPHPHNVSLCSFCGFLGADKKRVLLGPYEDWSAKCIKVTSEGHRHDSAVLSFITCIVGWL